MQNTTTVRLAKSTHELLKTLANNDGVTLDEEMIRLIRAERQRRIGDALAVLELDETDQAILNASAKDAASQ